MTTLFLNNCLVSALLIVVLQRRALPLSMPLLSDTKIIVACLLLSDTKIIVAC